MIEITDLTPDLESLWDQYVAMHPSGLIYYSLNYRNFLSSVTGGLSRYRVALDNNEIVGVLPIMELQGPYGRILNSLPFFGSYGAPLALLPNIKRMLLADWAALVAEDGVAAATIIANPLDVDEIPEGLIIDAQDYRSGQFTHLPSCDSIENDES